MAIQKPTALDSARIATELNKFKGAIIKRVIAGRSKNDLYIELLDKGNFIRFSISKKSAYIGIANLPPTLNDEIFKSIYGVKIISVEQLNYDRIVSFSIEKQDRLGRTKLYKIIFELIPNRGNAILIGDDDNIIESLKGSLKGKYSTPSPLNKPTILNFDDDMIREIISTGKDLNKSIYGLNGRDLLNLDVGNIDDPEDFIHDLNEYARKAQRTGKAWVIENDDIRIGFSLVEPELVENEIAIEYESALEMYEAYYTEAVEGESVDDRENQLKKILDTEIKKLQKKIKTIESEITESANADLYRLYGDLILANIGNINRGAESVIVKDFETDKEFEIKLEPKLSQSANAETYFKKSKKLKSSVKYSDKRLEKAKKKLGEYVNIKSATIDKPDILEESLIKLKLIKPQKSGKARKHVESRKPYKLYKASNGWDILVGRSNAENDELTLKIAKKYDYWFHAWQSAGSHTVLRLPDRNAIPDKQTLIEAAMLAAYYSKARNSSKVAVLYTEVKYVRKPRKFPPGKVLVEREKQLMVKPGELGVG